MDYIDFILGIIGIIGFVCCLVLMVINRNYYLAVLTKYAVFEGRARRKEYWYFFLFNFIITLVLVVIEGIDSSILSNIYNIAILLPSIAVGVRRMHDVNKSGWFLLIPVYNFILAVTEGTKGDNEYGPDPKATEIQYTKVSACTKCGEILEGNEKFCPSCGLDIDKEIAYADPGKTGEEEPDRPSNERAVKANPYQRTTLPKINIKLIVPLAVIVIALAIFAGIRLLGKPASEVTGPDAETEIVENVAEFISFHATRTTIFNPDGTESIEEFALIQFDLEDGTKVGKAVIDIINGTTTTAIIEEHLFETMDEVFYKGASNYLAIIGPIEPIEIEGDIVRWKVIDLKEKGTYTFADGSQYVGEFKDDLFHGQGTYTFADGDKYVGSFEDGMYNGQGTYTFADGDKYVGEWKDDLFHGQGTRTFADGDKYVGSFEDGMYNGQGTYTFADGEKYVGEFKEDQFHGQGTYTFADGSQYVGEFKDDLFHGQGTRTFADGDKYVGEWKDNLFHGQGTYTFADGEKYVGEFKEDQFHGQGTYTFADGEVWSGKWANDEYVGP